MLDIVPDHFWFDRIWRRHRIVVPLRARTAFRIGAGKAYDAVDTDLPILVAGGAPVVPGSSIKGVVRSSAEQLLRALAPEGEEERYACDFLEHQGSCLHDVASDDRKTSEARNVDVRRSVLEKVCRACATFGGMGVASHVRFADAPLAIDTRRRVRDSVAMDRDLRRAADKKKFDFEVVEADARIEMEIVAYNAEDWQLGLLLAVIDRIHDGEVRIGGFGSRGLGWFELAGPVAITARTGRDVVAGAPGAVLGEVDMAGLRRSLTVGF